MKYSELCKIEIVPNKSAAGVKLGTTKKTVKKHYGEPIEIDKISLKHESWRYENVIFWFESGKIDQIGICNHYVGKTKDGIGLASTRTEVIKIHGSLAWDGTWHVNSPPFGIAFDFESDLAGEQYVTDIFIFEEYY